MTRTTEIPVGRLKVWTFRTHVPSLIFSCSYPPNPAIPLEFLGEETSLENHLFMWTVQFASPVALVVKNPLLTQKTQEMWV